MRTFILVGLILLLVIVVVESDNKHAFGDIISFPRVVGKIKRAYKHFAVYVGPKNLFNQGEDKDIFHRIRKPIDGKYCVFGSLKNEDHYTENYLDGKLNKETDEDIIKHVKAMIEHCGKYNLFTNNCEHLATYVRYGRSFVRQPGTKVSFLCKFYPNGKPQAKADKAAEKISDEEVSEILKKLYANSEIEAEDMNEDQAVAAG